MAEDQAKASGPDLTRGVALAELSDGAKLLGHVGEEPVLLVRRGTEVFAVGALCTHYNGPLVDGLVIGDTVRCPWHHACFDLRTGEALRAPALSPVACWTVEQRDGKVFVREKRARPQLCRPCREVGRTRDRGRHRGQGLPLALQAVRARARRRLDLPGSRKPPSRGRDGAAAVLTRWRRAEALKGRRGQGEPPPSVRP